MIRISVHRAVETLRSAQRELSPKQFNKAVSRAINDSILVGRTEARTAVKSIYNIPQRYLSGINVEKSTSISLTAKLFASTRPIPMDAFAPKFSTATRSLTVSRRGEQRQRTFKRARAAGVGVSIEVIKGARETVPYAFMIPGAKPRVFARGEYRNGGGFGFVQRHKRVQKGGADTPVKPLLSVTVHAAVINKQALAKVNERVSTTFPKAVARNISFMLSRINSP